MNTFEEGFAATETAADSVLQALSDVTKVAKQLRKGAKEGNIAAIGRETARLEESLSAIRQQVGNATRAWPFTAEEELAYLEDGYVEELQDEAKKKGLQLFERDGKLVAHPSVVRVLSGDRAVEINRRKTSLIRPSKIMTDLENLQKSPFRSNPLQFLRALYNAYLILTSPRSRTNQLKMGEAGQVIPLIQIYNSWTGRPGTRGEYSQLDFARDLYNLENSGVNEVPSGARVSFPASAGTRIPSATISFVGPNGEPVLYYGIQFTGAGQ